jgi:hypothetical protein
MTRGAFGTDDGVILIIPALFRKLHFQMIDDILSAETHGEVAPLVSSGVSWF